MAFNSIGSNLTTQVCCNSWALFLHRDKPVSQLCSPFRIFTSPPSGVTRSRRCYAELPSAPASAALGRCFAFAPGLWTLVVPAPARLRQDTGFLHFALEAFEPPLKRIAWFNHDLCHDFDQRDRRSFERPERCAW
jgi:hypothetical protein